VSKSADSTRYYIRTIQFDGIHRTREGVLIRELPFKIPGYVTQKDLDYYFQRLRNLNLFKKIDLQVNRDTLLVRVDESLSFYIVPSFHAIERDWDKIIYGLMYVDFNFAGDKIYLFTYGWLGYNQGVSLAILDDWFTSKKLILGMNLSSGKFTNNNTQFEELQQRAMIQFGKRFRKDFYLTFGLGIHQVKIPEEERSLLGFDDNFFRYKTYSVQFSIDKRNYFVFPTRGYLVKILETVESKGILSFDYKHLQIDLREYIPVWKKVSLGLRQYFHGTSKNLPFYDGVYFGYDERIRGHFDLVISTRSIAEILSEIRFPIIPSRYYTFPSPIKSLQSRFTNLEFGLSGGIFIDQGFYADYWEKLSLKSRFYGYGFSLYFHLPYNNIFRFDVAFDEKGNREFILENIVSF
jgi:outer membrane protein assembly factor BamA